MDGTFESRSASDIQWRSDGGGARAERWRASVLMLGAVKATAKTGWSCGIVRDAFGRFRDHESLQTSLLLALSAKAKAVRLLVAIGGLRLLSAKEGGAELGGGNISCVHGERTGIVAACSPNADAALGLCVLSEDEAERHVQAAHREEEKRGDERELADVVGENRGSDESLEDPERAKAKLRTEHREKAIEEGHRPGDLGKDEEDELEDDEKAIDDCPEGTCWLIGNGATSYVAASSVVGTCFTLGLVDGPNI